MADHDPHAFVTSLGQKLAARSRHVCLFLGAGVGKACGLPDVKDLEQTVLGALDEENKMLLGRQLQNNNLEGALSRIRRIGALVTSDDTVDNLTAEKADLLDKKICQEIVRALNINTVETSPLIRLAAWAARSNYILPLELFTVNYDLLLESELEQMRVPYFDGFVGTLNARFHTELVEALPGSDNEAIPSFFIRLWKLHGSLNWAWDENGQVVRKGQAVPDELPAAIYPSDAKYSESRRVPFLVLHDRFRRALHQPETLLIISGYSFSDEHLNELIFNAATHRERSEFIAFLYSDIPPELSERATITPNLQIISRQEAIIAGIRAKWAEPEEALPDVWSDGNFLLPNFKYLAKYLARGTQSRNEGDSYLSKLLRKAIGGELAQGHEDVDV